MRAGGSTGRSDSGAWPRWRLTRYLVAAGVLVAGVVAWLGPIAGAQPQFWGDNGKIAFTSSRDGEEEVFTMNADGQPPEEPHRQHHS